MNAEFVERLLKLLAKHDDTHSIYWTEDLEFWVNCSDLFCWGCADGENITPENIHCLEQCYEDCKKAQPTLGKIYAPDLFACRVRGLRPQGAAYPKTPKIKDGASDCDYSALWSLFDACGPVRAVDYGNPKPPPYATINRSEIE